MLLLCLEHAETASSSELLWNLQDSQQPPMRSEIGTTEQKLVDYAVEVIKEHKTNIIIQEILRWKVMILTTYSYYILRSMDCYLLKHY